MRRIAYIIPAYQPAEPLPRLVKELIYSGIDPRQIIVVDDGSSPECKTVFAEVQEQGVHILRHSVNLGKGQALKTAFNQAQLLYPNLLGVVTLDADGQHAIPDVLKVATKLWENPEALVLGTRTFHKDIPLRSMLGNAITRYVFALFTGKRISDTQTGLRGIPSAILPDLLRITTMKYDYELEMLTKAVDKKTPVIEVPIRTIYEDGNASSHFDPVIDSFRVYFVFIRFSANSLATACIDYIIFIVSLGFGGILGATIIARSGAGVFNFFMNKRFVFKDSGDAGIQAFKYTLLVLIHMSISYGLITTLVYFLGFNVIISKLLVEATLFLASFALQHQFVFTSTSKYNVNKTDWGSYYKKKRGIFTFTRAITTRFLLSLFREHANEHIHIIAELGGANSSFYKSIRSRYPQVNYCILDNNEYGLAKFREHNPETNCSNLFNIDVLAPETLQLSADVVFSVGLIEHFAPLDTAKAIRTHFRFAREGGIVLISFPTPTPLYRFTRGFISYIGKWQFPDERPLPLDLVAKEVKKYGTILNQTYNPWIMLTQAIVVVRAECVGEKAAQVAPDPV